LLFIDLLEREREREGERERYRERERERDMTIIICTYRTVEYLPTNRLMKLNGCISRPKTLVLTREDANRNAKATSVLGSIVQTVLMTKHILFVGARADDEQVCVWVLTYGCLFT